jgi:hypothetical protein
VRGRHEPGSKWYAAKNEDRRRKVTSVTLDEETIDRLDEEATRRGVARSALVETAILELLAKARR